MESKEHLLRNIILGSVYNNLPGYAFFDVNDINKESIKDRIDWFENFNNDKYLKILDEEVIKEMLDVINQLKKKG